MTQTGTTTKVDSEKIDELKGHVRQMASLLVGLETRFKDNLVMLSAVRVLAEQASDMAHRLAPKDANSSQD
jgi:hypothetical protein